MLESGDVFEMRMPDQATGQCSVGFAPVYRLWNNRTDSNHRFTTDVDVMRQMWGKGLCDRTLGI